MNKMKTKPLEFGTPVILGGAALLIAIICLFLFYPKNTTSSDDFQKLGARFSQIETKLNAIEIRLDQTSQRLDTLEGQVPGFTQQFEQFQAIPNEVADTREKIEHLDKRLGNMERRVSGIRVSASEKKTSKTKKTSAKKAQSPQKSSSGSAKYHQVQQGDTLYGIARKYNISLSQLKKLNNMTDETILKLNQKIVVQP